MAYDEPFWERYFRYYDALDEAPPYRALQERVAELVAPAPGGRVLDAGCGTGNLVYRLRARGAEVVALDANRAGLRRTRGKARSTPLLHASLERPLPLADGVVDAVACVNVLYTLTAAGRRTFLAESRRVLRPGGCLVLANPRPGWKPLAIYAEAIRRWLERDGLVGGARRVLRFAGPTAAILYFNAQIQRSAGGRTFEFLTPEVLAAELLAAGLAPETPEPAYADQVLLVRAWRS